MTTESGPGVRSSGYSEEKRLEASRHRGVQKRLEPDICSVSAHIAEHNWTGLDGATHCRGCHAVWGGHQTIHCVSCHRTFSNGGTLDRHQTRYRDEFDELRVRCHDPATVTAGKPRRPVFGEPEPNVYGVPIWRRVGRNDQEVTK